MRDDWERAASTSGPALPAVTTTSSENGEANQKLLPVTMQNGLAANFPDAVIHPGDRV